LFKVRRTEEHTPKTLFDLLVADPYPFVQDQDPEKLTELFLLFGPPEDQVIVHKNHIDLSSKSVELERGIAEILEIVHYPRSFGIAIDVTDTGQIVFVGVDDAGPIPVTPEVSGSPNMFVVPDSNSGVEVLHGAMEIFLRSGADDVVMVRHEHNVVNEKTIFFMSFLQCLEEYAYDLSLIEPERPIVGSTNQVVG